MDGEFDGEAVVVGVMDGEGEGDMVGDADRVGDTDVDGDGAARNIQDQTHRL